jgi:hypothetical protein
MLFPVTDVWYFNISTFRSMCSVPNIAVLCSSLMCFPCILFRYFLNDFEMAPLASSITDMTCVFIFRVCYISIERFFNFKIFSVFSYITFLFPEIATSTNIHIPLSLSRIMMSGLLLGMILLVCTCWFHKAVTLLTYLLTYSMEQSPSW